MPIQKFSNAISEEIIDVRHKNTIRLLSVSFSKGFEHSEWLEFELHFGEKEHTGFLLFKSAVRDQKQQELFFYRGNGAVFTIPEGLEKMKIKVISGRNIDFEFVLTYDFYPGTM